MKHEYLLFNHSPPFSHVGHDPKKNIKYKKSQQAGKNHGVLLGDYRNAATALSRQGDIYIWVWSHLHSRHLQALLLDFNPVGIGGPRRCISPFSSAENFCCCCCCFFKPTLQFSDKISPVWIDTSVILQAVATSCISWGGKSFLPATSCQIYFVNRREMNSLSQQLTSCISSPYRITPCDAVKTNRRQNRSHKRSYRCHFVLSL